MQKKMIRVQHITHSLLVGGITLWLMTLWGCGMELQPRTLSADPEFFGLERAEKEGNAVAGSSVLADFNTDRQGFFTCGEYPMTVEDGAMKLEMTDARFLCIGKNLDVVDLTKTPFVHIRGRIEREGLEEVTVLVRFTDENDNETNYKPEHKPWRVNQQYRDFVYDFSEKLVSVNGTFDPTAIVKMKVFFNTKGSSDFTGTVFLDEIRFAGD